jgi:anti-anti-sigma regulatory factor
MRFESIGRASGVALMQIESQGRTITIGFDARADVAAVKAAREVLVPLIDRQFEAWMLDGSNIGKVDCAFLQLLLALLRALHSRGTPWRWLATSPTLVNSAVLLGIAHELELANGQAEPS